MVVLWQTDAIKMEIGALPDKLFEKIGKKSISEQFLWFFANNFAGRGPSPFFIASVCHNTTIAHPPTGKRTLYDQN